MYPDRFAHNCRNAGCGVPHAELFRLFPGPYIARAIPLTHRRLRWTWQTLAFRLALRSRTLHPPGVRLRHRRHPSDRQTAPTRRAHLALPRRARRDCRHQHDALRGTSARIAASGGDQRYTADGRVHTTTDASAHRISRPKHNATEACTGILEKEGRVVGEATASHVYSAPWAMPIACRPAGYQRPAPPSHLDDKTPSPPPPPGSTPRPTRAKQPVILFDPDVPVST